MTARTESAGSGSDHETLNVRAFPAPTGSGESVAELRVGARVVTVNVPEREEEHALDASQAKAK
jgi:hypothetical protein